jgi:hypothetical protein
MNDIDSTILPVQLLFVTTLSYGQIRLMDKV